jgi:adenylate cyclase class 2
MNRSYKCVDKYNFYIIIMIKEVILMHKEYECTILEVDVNSFISKIEKMGAKKIGEFNQKRYVYDFNPINKNKWIRLRTDGKTSTLTIKEIVDKNEIDGTNEIEIEVSSFENANKILNELGYVARNYQENKRIKYTLDGVEIDIDFWPLIPPYVEIEGKNENDVRKMIERLKIDKNMITTLDVASIYNQIYNIDILKIEKLELKK